ncbi:MAG: hypothetical protein ABSC17_05925 [Thermacetogeniaceae bacterium]
MSGAKRSALEQKLHYYPGVNPSILVAAPHHGYQRGCDYYTKEFALILSAQLGAALLVADGLMPLVDLNKEPLQAATPELQSLCLTYQKHALAEPVYLFLEVHGHIHGRYDLEISCGFELSPAFPFDQELRVGLSTLDTALHREIDRHWQSWFPLPSPSVGIFPDNRQVVMKATKTYLFQRIRSLQLQGRRIFGLHLEVYRDYKTGDRDSPYAACQQALAEALAASIAGSFGAFL